MWDVTRHRFILRFTQLHSRGKIFFCKDLPKKWYGRDQIKYFSCQLLTRSRRSSKVERCETSDCWDTRSFIVWTKITSVISHFLIPFYTRSCSSPTYTYTRLFGIITRSIRLCMHRLVSSLSEFTSRTDPTRPWRKFFMYYAWLVDTQLANYESEQRVGRKVEISNDIQKIKKMKPFIYS